KGSEAWKQYKNELADVQKQTQALKKDVDLTQLTYGQLQNYVKDLNKELKGLKPGTDEFVAATKRLSEAEKQLSDVKTQMDDIKRGAEDLAKPGVWDKIVASVA
ncbi:hypothetical protein, partial [Arsenicibacter rosenii]|uniref:hypothetical protein n=1 Tax=Arsenicibacter rosenii TaxID=1750698 RepID=UPI0015A4F5F0